MNNNFSFSGLKGTPATPPKVDVMVLNVGFEPRCASVIQNLPNDFCRNLVLCEIDGSGTENWNLVKKSNLYTKLNSSNDIQVADLSSRHPIGVADKFIEILVQLNPTKVAIDITSFTHEFLLVVLKILELRLPECTVYIFYTRAESYNDNQEENRWLSRGVRDIRNVLGYSGIHSPRRETHLTVLAGFEVERAFKIIEEIEPDAISLGFGDSSSISPEVLDRNKNAVKEIEKWIAHSRVEKFTFSPFDPFSAKSSILEVARKFEAYNRIVLPMNTKVSTIAVALASKEIPEMQIIYGLAEEYNKANYSNAGSNALFFEMG